MAAENAQLRKASFGAREAARLEEMRPQLEMLMPQRVELAREQNRLGDAIEGAVRRRKEAATGKGGDTGSSASTSDPVKELADLQWQAKEIKQRSQAITEQLDVITAESLRLRLQLPNWTHPGVPVGPEENARLIGVGGSATLLPDTVREAFKDAEQKLASGPISLGDAPNLAAADPDPARDHLNLCTQHRWIDNQASQQVTGSSWPFLLGPLALLEHALVAYAMDAAVRAGFSPTVVPDVVKRDILSRTGFSPREGAGGQVYWVREDGSPPVDSTTAESPDELSLAATAEITLAGLCAGTLFDQSALPKQLVASSHAFRAEAGARGLESRGLYRVHQFTKVELFVVCCGGHGEDSSIWLENLRSIQESILSGLGVPYRVLDMPTEELGASAFRKYDIEAWMPGRGSWGEVSSASNCTEYQARRLMIRYKPEQEHSFTRQNVGQAPPAAVEQRISESGAGNAWAHTLNGTAVAVPRLIVALLENYGISQDARRIRLPRTLEPFWLGGQSDAVEWLDVAGQPLTRLSASEGRLNRPLNPSSPRQSVLRASMERVRAAAKRSGSDPASMVVAFLVLHELTAILPLVLLFYLFWLLGAGEAVVAWLQEASSAGAQQQQQHRQAPSGAANSSILSTIRARVQEYLNEGMQRAERYGRHKGYFGFEKGSGPAGDHGASSSSADGGPTAVVVAGTFANAVAAYAVVKILFPLRIAACAALAGPFARVCIEPIKRLARRQPPAASL